MAEFLILQGFIMFKNNKHKMKELDKMTTQQKLNKKGSETVSIECKECRLTFGVDSEYIGIITCPYCGEYVEG